MGRMTPFQNVYFFEFFVIWHHRGCQITFYYTGDFSRLKMEQFDRWLDRLKVQTVCGQFDRTRLRILPPLRSVGGRASSQTYRRTPYMT